MNNGWYHALGLRVLPRLLSLLLLVWLGTCRVRVHGDEYRERLLDGEQPTIVTFWHYGLLVVLHQLRRYRGVAMVSASRDGEYIARLLHCFGLETVRGSRNNHGVQALKDLLRAAKKGRNTAIVADGSQGPPLVAQPGSVLLASRTGQPILPVGWSASSYFALHSWDRTAIPKPFATIDLVFGEPLEVPPGLKDEGIEEYRQLLEERLRALYGFAWRQQKRNGH